MSHARRALPLLLTASVAVALAGCGGSGGSSDAAPSPAASPVSPQLRLQSASDVTSRAGSSRFVLTTDSTVAGKKITVVADGATDAARQLGRVDVELGDQTIEERIVGDALYLAVPGQQAAFYRLSLADLTGTSLASSTDPTAGLQALKAASSDVTTVGTEKVRDAGTTHYKGTYDAKAALAEVQGAAGQQLSTLLQGSDLSTVPFDAWVDDQGRVRRFVQALTVNASGQQVQTTSTIEVFDFGTQVDVVAPPADQVWDGAPLLQALKGAQTS